MSAETRALTRRRLLQRVGPGAIRPRVTESDPGHRPGPANALPSPEPSGREEGSRRRPCHRHGRAVLSLHSETGLGPGTILSPRRDHSWPSASTQVSSAAEILTDCGRVVPQGGQALHPRVRPRLAGPGKGRGAAASARHGGGRHDFRRTRKPGPVATTRGFCYLIVNAVSQSTFSLSQCFFLTQRVNILEATPHI